MATIDITAMRGDIPRIVEHLLPNANAILAQGYNFRHSVIIPMLDYTVQGKAFTFKPKTGISLSRWLLAFLEQDC
ncbi:hypothetical protein [Dickeya oryzae]|uniref:Uncharacterized protein n=1 Tax=Dickeya oryzae TaxID=1240404 RepID=A0AB39INI7_9GAMM|nr:hypothetical protein [Dickeya oryzae]MCA6996030.1 hypothetical protein [Dickeya oryzae]